MPSGAVADRFSRRGALVAAGVLQAAGYTVWILLPGFPGFAAGFVLWGLGGALISGAQEALLYDGLSAVGAVEHYALVQGRVGAAGLLTQLPSAGLATVLFAIGGYPLVGWVSVGVCLAAAALASLLPEPPRGPDDESNGAGYLATLRAGVVEVASRPVLRAALTAAAVLGGLDAIEEYFPLVTLDVGIPVEAVPLAMLPITVVGAAGAALGGAAYRLPRWGLAAVLGAAVLALGASVLVLHPAAIVAIALFYGLYRMVLVVVDARLQDRIDGSARATVTSVAGLGVEIVGLGVFAAWAAGGGLLVAGLWLAVALVLPRWLREPVKG